MDASTQVKATLLGAAVGCGVAAALLWQAEKKATPAPAKCSTAQDVAGRPIFPSDACCGKQAPSPADYDEAAAAAAEAKMKLVVAQSLLDGDHTPAIMLMDMDNLRDRVRPASCEPQPRHGHPHTPRLDKLPPNTHARPQHPQHPHQPRQGRGFHKRAPPRHARALTQLIHHAHAHAHARLR